MADGEYEVFQVDTEITDIMAYATDTSKDGYQGKPASSFIPRDEWNKLSQEQKDRLIAKRRQERMKQYSGNWKPNQPRRQVNVYDVSNVVHANTLIDYAIMNHDVLPPIPTEYTTDASPSSDADTLLAYMAGRGTEETPGNIRNVLAAKRAPDNKGRNRTANKNTAVPSTVKIGDIMYYLNKGETITFQGHRYFSHMTMTSCISQHDVATMEKALVDRGANGGICGDDMLVLEGSERFVDVIGLAGHKIIQISIITAQALITTHKGDAIATFHQMALLGKGQSILSCLQMEAHGAEINDRSRILSGGKQCISIDECQIPLDFKNGLT
jgi:hypothetical protein